MGGGVPSSSSSIRDWETMTNAPGRTQIGRSQLSVLVLVLPPLLCHCLFPTGFCPSLPTPTSTPAETCWCESLTLECERRTSPGGLRQSSLGVRQMQPSRPYSKVHADGKRQTSEREDAPGPALCSGSPSVSAPLRCLPCLPCPRTGDPSHVL